MIEITRLEQELLHLCPPTYGITADQLGAAMDLPTRTTVGMLNDLHAHGLVERMVGFYEGDGPERDATARWTAPS